MAILKMFYALKFFTVICLLGRYIPVGHSKELYQMNINETGTVFNETIEIDDVEKTVFYKVPSHNQIKETDVLVDYKNGILLRRIPEREECYVMAIPTAEEQPLRKTRLNLKLVQKTIYRNKSAVQVVKVKTIMTIIREIPREELTPKIVDFCGNNTAYQVKEELQNGEKDKRVLKRVRKATRQYKLALLQSADRSLAEKRLPNGYLTCKKVNEHTKAVMSCVNKGINPRVGCGLYPLTCRYLAFCELLPSTATKTPATGSFIKQRGDAPFVYIAIKCAEEHKFTEMWCCDVLEC